MTGAKPSARLLALLERDAAAAGLPVELLPAPLEDLGNALQGRRFDLVCGHGLLMYFPDRQAALTAMAAWVGPGGRLSVTVRQQAALAFRPGLRRDWAAALTAFEGGSGYVSELGVAARADTLEDVPGDLTAVGLTVTAWYGVRVSPTSPPWTSRPPQIHTSSPRCSTRRTLPDAPTPYRLLASQLLVLATRS